MDKHWYPKIFDHYKDTLFRKSDYTIVSHIEDEDYSKKYYFTALIDPSKIDLLKPNKIGCMPVSSGPHPFLPEVGNEYIPSFWIHSQDKNLELEPLIIYYESNNKSLIWPDQGFLMTYGLIPRFLKDGDEIIWDEPALPELEIIKCNPISNYEWGTSNAAEILIKNKYLLDYSTLRNKSIIQIYYEKINCHSDTELDVLLKDKKSLELTADDRYYYFQLGYNQYKYIAEIGGFKLLFKPGHAPVTYGRWIYGELIWPGIDKPVTKDYALSTDPMTRVFVSDSVFETYEGKKDYDINPESGSVSYSNQWSVGFCHRVGRNIISIELKKMYEGVPPEVVKHWHSHSVSPPDKEYYKQKDISIFAKELLNAYLIFGKSLSKSISIILQEAITQKDIIDLDEKELEYYGWTSNSFIEVITRRIPQNMNKNQFLQRCNYLDVLLVEGLSEKYLRKTLLKYGIDNKVIERYRSIKLLALLVELKIISNKTGLEFTNSFSGIIERLEYDKINDSLKEFFALNALRQLSSHRIYSDSNGNFNLALKTFQIDISSAEKSFMDAIESVYEKLTKSLIQINRIFEQ
ncbi:MAG: hypothetical protein WCZ90_05335 [Melioribacteraceae bacterium]